MHRAIPVSNKLLELKWNKINKEQHRRRLREMKSCIDSKTPGSLPTHMNKAKKYQLEEGTLLFLIYIDRYT